MATKNNVQLRAARNVLLNALLAPPQPGDLNQQRSQLLPTTSLEVFPVNDLPLCYFPKIELDTPGTIFVLGVGSDMEYNLLNLSSPDQNFNPSVSTLDLLDDEENGDFTAFQQVFSDHENSDWRVFSGSLVDPTLVELEAALLVSQVELSQNFRERWRNVLQFTTPNIIQDTRLAIEATRKTGLTSRLQHIVRFQTKLSQKGELLVADRTDSILQILVRGSQKDVEYQAFNNAHIGLMTAATSTSPIVVSSSVSNSFITVTAGQDSSITVSVESGNGLSQDQPVDFEVVEESGISTELKIFIFGQRVPLDKIKTAWIKEEDKGSFQLQFTFDHLGNPVKSTGLGEVTLEVPSDEVDLAAGIGVRAFQRVAGNQPFEEVFLDARLRNVVTVQDNIGFQLNDSSEELIDLEAGDFQLDFPSTQEGVSYSVHTVDLPIDFSFKIQAEDEYHPDGTVSNTFITDQQAAPPRFQALFGGKSNDGVTIPLSIHADQLIMIRAMTIGRERWMTKLIVARTLPNSTLVIEPDTEMNKVKIIGAEPKVGYLVVSDDPSIPVPVGQHFFLPAANNLIGWEAHGHTFGMQIAATVPAVSEGDSLFRIEGTPVLATPSDSSAAILLDVPHPGPNPTPYKILACREFNGLSIVLDQKIEQAPDGTITLIETP